MNNTEENLKNWQSSLLRNLPVGGLHSRSNVAYKWKTPFRCWVLREVTFWRITDLLTQSHSLFVNGYLLGARILLRSSIETLAILIYLNDRTNSVLRNELDFHQYSDETTTLLLGSRDGTTNYSSKNILTVLDKCEIRYPGLRRIYSILSESAHPNYEGMICGYTKISLEDDEVNFKNNWKNMHGHSHLEWMDACMEIFHNEYDKVWPELIEKLEAWIATNDSYLEQTILREKPTP